MNFFKSILIGLLIFLIVLIGIGFLLPSHMEVQRTLVIEAPPQQIQPWLDNMKRWELWIPWNKQMDQTVEYIFSGPEKGVGATLSWQGAKLGQGSLKLTKVEPKVGVQYEITFDQGNLLATGSLAYEPVPEGTRLIWEDRLELGKNPLKRYLGLLLK